MVPNLIFEINGGPKVNYLRKIASVHNAHWARYHTRNSSNEISYFLKEGYTLSI